MPLAEFQQTMFFESDTIVGEFSVWKEKGIKIDPSARQQNVLDA